jgi:hypothetical protein
VRFVQRYSIRSGGKRLSPIGGIESQRILFRSCPHAARHMLTSSQKAAGKDFDTVMASNAQAPHTIIGPLWQTRPSWEHANHTVASFLRRYHSRLDRAKYLAAEIKQGLTSIFPLMEEFCLRTCPQCHEPCCRRARVWTDFKDLLFMHLAGIQTPPHQIIRDRWYRCCFLGDAGCRLSRLSRPWICTWYICPSQTAMLRVKSRSIQSVYRKTVEHIRACRVDMEAVFMAAVS